MNRPHNLSVGDKVTYFPTGEIGIVKEITDHTDLSVRVVYNCDNNWGGYMNYTSALTNISDLEYDWIPVITSR